MTFPTFVPPFGTNTKFAPGTSEDHTPSILVNNFGDGYVQRTPDGLNHDLARLSPKFEVMTYAEAETIMAFFKARKGTEPFWFQLPGAASPQKWVCTSWSRSWDGEVTQSVTANFQEVVDAE
ncbi:minor tail protein M [Rhizobium phage RHph_Y1_11]|nr:minor tail protein M [Rhizobium phage RHph_Y1_11]